jgi:uncharacterized membrane protein
MTNYPGDESLAVRANKWALWSSRYWLRVLLVVLGMYAGLPLLAPVLMEVGATAPASLIYRVYSATCHQFAFRSWFFFGEQVAYPREGARIEGLETYESIMRRTGETLILPQYEGNQLDEEYTSRDFLGNQTMGYKTAICQRDVAIYVALFLGGIVYMIPAVRRHLRPVPLWLYFWLGIVPIGIDGFSQLLSQPPWNMWAYRETTPLFRLITGALFGFMNAWLAFPYLERTAVESMRQIRAKFAAREARQNDTSA